MSSRDNLSARTSSEKYFSTRIMSTVLDMTAFSLLHFLPMAMIVSPSRGRFIPKRTGEEKRILLVFGLTLGRALTTRRENK